MFQPVGEGIAKFNTQQKSRLKVIDANQLNNDAEKKIEKYEVYSQWVPVLEEIISVLSTKIVSFERKCNEATKCRCDGGNGVKHRHQDKDDMEKNRWVGEKLDEIQQLHESVNVIKNNNSSTDDSRSDLIDLKIKNEDLLAENKRLNNLLAKTESELKAAQTLKQITGGVDKQAASEQADFIAAIKNKKGLPMLMFEDVLMNEINDDRIRIKNLEKQLGNRDKIIDELKLKVENIPTTAMVGIVSDRIENLEIHLGNRDKIIAELKLKVENIPTYAMIRIVSDRVENLEKQLGNRDKIIDELKLKIAKIPTTAMTGGIKKPVTDQPGKQTQQKKVINIPVTFTKGRGWCSDMSIKKNYQKDGWDDEFW